MSNLVLLFSKRLDRVYGLGARVWNEPDDGNVVEGTVITGAVENTHKCDAQSYWTIQETASGIDVQFTFNVTGKSKKVKIKGKWAGTNSETLSVQAWNGVSWDEIDTITESFQDKTYTASLGDQYTIDGVTKVRVYRANGINDVLWLDCISVLAQPGDGGGSTCFIIGSAIIGTSEICA